MSNEVIQRQSGIVAPVTTNELRGAVGQIAGRDSRNRVECSPEIVIKAHCGCVGRIRGRHRSPRSRTREPSSNHSIGRLTLEGKVQDQAFAVYELVVERNANSTQRIERIQRIQWY